MHDKTTQTLLSRVRGYCEDRIKTWSERYAHRTEEVAEAPLVLTAFPRAQVMRSILFEVDQLDTLHLGQVGEARRQLVDLAEATKSSFAPPFCQDVEQEAVEEECRLFENYVLELSTEELASAPL